MISWALHYHLAGTGISGSGCTKDDVFVCAIARKCESLFGQCGGNALSWSSVGAGGNPVPLSGPVSHSGVELESEVAQRPDIVCSNATPSCVAFGFQTLELIFKLSTSI